MAGSCFVLFWYVFETEPKKIKKVFRTKKNILSWFPHFTWSQIYPTQKPNHPLLRGHEYIHTFPLSCPSCAQCHSLLSRGTASSKPYLLHPLDYPSACVQTSRMDRIFPAPPVIDRQDGMGTLQPAVACGQPCPAAPVWVRPLLCFPPPLRPGCLKISKLTGKNPIPRIRHGLNSSHILLTNETELIRL